MALMEGAGRVDGHPCGRGGRVPLLERGSPVVRSRLLSQGRPARRHDCESASRLTPAWWCLDVPESTPKATIPVSIRLFPKGDRSLTDKKPENQDNPSRDEVLKRMLKMKPQPHAPKLSPVKSRKKPTKVRQNKD